MYVYCFHRNILFRIGYFCFKYFRLDYLFYQFPFHIASFFRCFLCCKRRLSYCTFFFGSKTVPISKIESIKPTNSIESAPATSIFNRIAISFVDRTIMKGSMPLIISPSDKQKFISQPISINPKIKVKWGG